MERRYRVMFKSLMKSSGISALAMMLAMGAMPAQTLAAESAQRDRAENQRGGGNAWGGQSSRQRGNEARAPRMGTQSRPESRATPSRSVESRSPTPRMERHATVRTQPTQSRSSAPAALPQGWQRDFRNAGNTARAADTRTPPTPAPPRAEQRTERYGDWRDDRRGSNDTRDSNRGNNTRNTDRNRSYADRDRNRSYTDRDRNQNRDWNRQNTRRDDRDQSRSRDRSDARRYYYQDGKRHEYNRWSHNSWRNDRRYNWSDYRRSNAHVYRIGRYYAPYHGHRYSRLSIGLFLGSGFYASNYWINDPWQYRLPAAYGPYRWVRYYDDALLVDIYSGEVVDVIHDFFW